MTAKTSCPIRLAASPKFVIPDGAKASPLLNIEAILWDFDQFKSLILNLIFGAIATAALFGVVRRMPRTWWIWGAVVTTAFLMLQQ